MHRREFNLGILKISTASLLTSRLFAHPLDDSSQNSTDSTRTSTTTLYKNAVIIDTLCSPIDLTPPLKADDLAAVRQSGMTAVNCTVSQNNFEDTVDNISGFEELIDQHPEMFLIVRRHADIARAKREGKVGIMFGFQYTSFLEQDPERIDIFRRLGVRIMQITYNNRSIFGDGCLEPGNAGLSKAGIAAIKKMNERGVAVDLSHSGYRTTAEGITQSEKPVLITHAGCAAVYAHPRSKPDEILKSLADRGGTSASTSCPMSWPHPPSQPASTSSIMYSTPSTSAAPITSASGPTAQSKRPS